MENKLPKFFIAGAVYLILFFCTFCAFQQKDFYSKTLGNFTKQYENIDGERYKKDKPYEIITNEKLLNWDAAHYNRIKETVYEHNENTPDEYILAFFPLFPLIWKFSQLTPLGIIFLNFFLYLTSYIVIFKIFIPNDNKNQLALFCSGLTMPIVVVYLIPYTEGVFLASSALCIYGMIRKNYLLYFSGGLLLAATRPAITIITLAIICTEIFFFIRHRNLANSLKEIFIKVFPLLTGTILVGLLQMYYESPSLINFALVQKYWGHHLQVPTGLSDWSHEGFALNVPALSIFVSWGVFILAQHTFKNWKKSKSETLSSFNINTPSKDNKYYLLILSIIYQLGTTLYIIFFSGGNLHGLFRYLLCTPFFLIILFTWVSDKNLRISGKFYAITIVIALIIKLSTNYASRWDFSALGFILLFASIGYFLYLHKLKFKARMIIGAVILLFNIVWTTFMFNSFLCNGWIFT